MNLPIPLYKADTVRQIDRRAIESCGIPSLELMTRAGAATWRVLRARYPRARNIVVVCGPGNNGGDGYVVARLAKAAGARPVALSVAGNGTGEMPTRSACETAGVPILPFDVTRLQAADVIVDGILGTGLSRNVAGELCVVIDAINASRRPVVAIDIPSGLHADTGAVMGTAVKANITVSFIALKAGLFTGDGCDYAGEVVFDDLDVPSSVYEGAPVAAQRLSVEALRGVWRPRRRNAHKGEFGHVLVIGGGPGMAGAARLCGEAALRTGAGLVTVATHPSHAAMLNATRPELIVHGVRTARDLSRLLDRATVVALGPGLSQDAWARVMWRTALGSGIPAVVDADALNLLAAKPAKQKDWVLTPHPGEAARLLKTTTLSVQRDRFVAVAVMVKRYGGVCVLKGAGTLIASSAATVLCDRGNPAMASGGTGDVLTGVIAGLRAQNLSAFDAARLGVWVHACAGDQAACAGHGGLIASDIFPFIRNQLGELSDDDSLA